MRLRLCVACVMPLLAIASSAFAVTVSDITSALSSNANAVQDLSANIVIDSSNNSQDVSAGTYALKAATDTYKTNGKFCLVSTSPDSGTVKCDGTDVAIGGRVVTKSTFVSGDDEEIGWVSRAQRDMDIPWLLANNTFALEDGTCTVNSVTCRKISSSQYVIYVDDSQYAKVVRIEAVNGGSVLRRYDMAGYSYIQSAAWAATQWSASKPGTGDTTYAVTLSNIVINQGLSDSTFAI